jgi:hypothetical protein
MGVLYGKYDLLDELAAKVVLPFKADLSGLRRADPPSLLEPKVQ